MEPAFLQHVGVELQMSSHKVVFRMPVPMALFMAPLVVCSTNCMKDWSSSQEEKQKCLVFLVGLQKPSSGDIPQRQGVADSVFLGLAGLWLARLGTLNLYPLLR